ncbi:coiled-coil domain-containing protein 57 isoform X1 [Pipistrellus kuhlii]|uniref:Coiled-coil domain containing 57 n=1 Tax=Pipistrellus kuhlii TaxID=59472 RepID=A0A7J7SEG0_PIPKU|nr:coiled-coil domain-containing protein 57 isoform X1 [Pipistrellus kuhlii]KAF6286714.1 coiled-coil domain containing 57 [Pipistrellus kuhlii]
MLPPPSEQALSELLARKEEEWRALQAQRARLQEAALQDAQRRLEEAEGWLRRLQEDFVYNLQLLEERDRELERYDAAFAQAQRLQEARQAEASELKIEAAKLRQALAAEARRREDLQQQLQLKLQEHRLALEQAHSDKNVEVDRQREQYEKLKWQLERKLQELDGELALQRQELLLEFESEVQKREHGFRLHADSMSSTVLTHELKVKLLTKELAALRGAGAQAAGALQDAQEAKAELEERLQRAAWELRDLAAVKDARIKDLEDKLQSLQLALHTEQETFRRKHQELDRAARERDAVLASVKGAHAEQLRALEARVLELQAQCEARELQVRRAEWRQADALKEKDAAMDKLREEASALRAGWDAQLAQLSKETTSKDLQVQSLQEDTAQLRAQLARCQQDVGRYQRELSLAVEREQSLERDKVQLGLDWQRRCEGLERDHYLQSEGLVQGLASARAQIAAKLQEAEQRLRDQEVVLRALTLERDQALQALRDHGLSPEQEVPGPPPHQGEEASAPFPSGEIQRLQEQNASLRHAVAQMRAEMEALSEQVLPPAQPAGDAAASGSPADAAPGYVLALEAEIRNLKGKFKTLEEQLGEALQPSKTPASPADARPSAGTTADAPGGALAADGASLGLGLALRRLGDRARLLSFLVARLREKVLWQPLQGDAGRQELAHEADQVLLEVRELQKQVSELEKHLAAAPAAPDCVALGRQGPAAGVPTGTEGPGSQPPQALSVQRLQRKLKEAARVVLRLRREKEQLLELGNRLRAQLGQPEGKPCHPCPSPEARKRPGPGPPLGQLQPPVTAQDARSPLQEPSSKCSGESQVRGAPPVRRQGARQRQHRLPAAACLPARQKENRSPRPQARGACPDAGHRSQGSSSLASSSLRDTWKVLELGSSPSGLTSQDDSVPERAMSPAAAEGPARAAGSPVGLRPAFSIKGMRIEAQTKAKPARPSRAHPAKPKGCQQHPKVRNYNFKD